MPQGAIDLKIQASTREEAGRLGERGRREVGGSERREAGMGVSKFSADHIKDNAERQ